jgi:hypothetical protein
MRSVTLVHQLIAMLNDLSGTNSFPALMMTFLLQAYEASKIAQAVTIFTFVEWPQSESGTLILMLKHVSLPLES